MPEGLRRIYGLGHLHFVTFSCYQRLPLLEARQARDFFVCELARAREENGFLLVGYVVMPEHVQLLMGEPERGTPSTVLHDLKLRVARKLRKARRLGSCLSGAPGSPFEPGSFSGVPGSVCEPGSCVSRGGPRSHLEPGCNSSPSPRSFWQARFYDFNVFTDKKKREKLEYMHANPVTRGLVAHPKDWPWSSWSNYANHGQGLILVDLL